MRAARVAAGGILAVLFAAAFWISASHEAKASKQTGMRRGSRWMRRGRNRCLPSMDTNGDRRSGRSCMTPDDHVVTVNRGFQTGGLWARTARPRSDRLR